MDAYTDIQLARDDMNKHTSTENVSVVCEREASDITFTEGLFPENSHISDVHICPVVTDAHDAKAHEQDSVLHVNPLPQEHSDTHPAVKEISYKHGCTNPEGDSNQTALPVIFEEVPLSELPVVPPGGSTTTIGFRALEDLTVIDSREPPLFHLRIVSEAAPRDEKQRDLEHALDCTRILGTEPDHAQGGDFARLVDEEEAREDLDHPYEDFASSQPLSSSPPHLFSSSPCASSQSSEGGVEPLKSVAKVDVSANSHSDHVALAAQRLETGLPKTKDCLEMDSALCVKGPGHSRKRMTYESGDNESNELQPAKRSRMNSRPYPPPTPIRATLASQNRQFKKLAAPFRPPSKLPVSRNKTVQTIKSSALESAEISHDKPVKELATDVLPPQHKVSSASRSVSQFKSPLKNKVLPANNRTIRLTPALQALERQLQLLKRAVKVKEDNEEEVLTRLAGKWIEAGREVAYDVWDATKDMDNFEGKAMLIRRSYGWESTNDGNTPWGWDAGPEDADQESRLDSSMAPGATERPIVEEDDGVVFNNTLGTMLRQLGIAPEVFGWDDDKETFSDEH